MSNFNHLPPEHRNPLTDLPNSLAIKSALDTAIQKMPGRFGLLAMDADGLKDLNDRIGHHKGDEFLRKIGGVLETMLRRSDLYLPGHVGGDEFSVVIHDIDSNNKVRVVQERIRKTLGSRGIEMSIGGRLHKKGETAVQLSEAADALMYADKKRRQVERYDRPGVREAVDEIRELTKKSNINPRDLPSLMRLREEGKF